MTKKKDGEIDFNKALMAGLSDQTAAQDAASEASEDLIEDGPYQLTEAEKDKIMLEVKREMAAEARKEAMELYKEKAKLQAKAEAMFKVGKDDTGEDLATIDFWLASHPKYAMLDGVVYHSGRTYTKKRGVIAVLAETMWRTMLQEERRLGEKNEFTHMPQYRKVLTSKGLQIRPA